MNVECKETGNCMKLALGNKVFKVPKQSKRRSPRTNKRNMLQKNSDVYQSIMHDLFLQPTLNRQRKKKRQRERRDKLNRMKNLTLAPSLRCGEKNNNNSNDKNRKIEWNGYPRHGLAMKINTRTNTKKKKNERKQIDIIKIRRLARCGGLKRIWLDTSDEMDRVKVNEEPSTGVPPPFVAREDDLYIVPEPGRLISCIWHTRHSPAFDRKRIYRTGVLCNNNGLIRFFNGDNDASVTKDDKVNVRNFYQSKFYLNKRVFKEGSFRIRTDLTVGAECYENKMNLSCKIVEIDISSGAVLVESLCARDGAKERLWISPDELVGKCKMKTTVKKETTKDGEQSDNYDESSHAMSQNANDRRSQISYPSVLIDDVNQNVKGSIEGCVLPQNKIDFFSYGPSLKPHIVSSNEGSYETNRFKSISRMPLLSSLTAPANCSHTEAQLELMMLKMHGKSLEILSSVTELPTMVASLQYVRSMQQSDIPLGSTAQKVVAEAEITIRALMEDVLRKQFTLPVCYGGKGYDLHHAAMILCLLGPILGSKLGEFHGPSINISKLLSLGLTNREALDIFPFIEKFKNDIFEKILLIKRELVTVCF